MHKLVLPLLGERAYLQGTTLFDALHSRYCPEGRMVFKVSHMILSNTVEASETPPHAEEAAATLSWHTPDGSMREIFVRALPPTEPVAREPFDEDRIWALAQWGKGTVYHPDLPADETFVRCVVSLHKALLKREIPHTDPGQWLFTRLELPRPLVPGRELTLTLRQTFGGAAALSDIANEHGPVGSIFFSWLKK